MAIGNITKNIIQITIISCRAIRIPRNCCNIQGLMGHLSEVCSHTFTHSFQNYEQEHF